MKKKNIPLQATIRDIQPMGLRARLMGGPEVIPAAGLGGAGEEELEDAEAPAALAAELGVAETRGDVVECDGGFIILVGVVHARGEFAAVEDLEEFGDGVSNVSNLMAILDFFGGSKEGFSGEGGNRGDG